MRLRLYQKLLVWLFLHLLLLVSLAAALVGGILLKGSDGLLPTYLFSSNIENAFRTISAHCQYTSVRQWDEILEQYDRGPALSYVIYPLDDPSFPLRAPEVPARLRAAAARIPRHPFTLCPDPSILLPGQYGDGALTDGYPYPAVQDIYGPNWAELLQNSGQPEAEAAQVAQVDTQGLDVGIPLTPKALFMRTSNPTRYWLGRPLVIPDENNQLHYVLMAASSDSIFGHGLYFDIKLILGVLGAGLLVSCLWWWPFVRHITRPLERMEDVTARLVDDDAAVLARLQTEENICAVSPGRSDEIGRLSLSINAMARQMHGMLVQQRRFISHIAHEINSPLARVQFGLALLEEQTQGAKRQKTRQVLEAVERLSGITVDVLNFLREEFEPHPVKFAELDLGEFLSELIEFEIPPDAEVCLDLPEGLKVRSPERYLRRALRTVIGNLPQDALYEGCLKISAQRVGGKIRLRFTLEDPGCCAAQAGLQAQKQGRASRVKAPAAPPAAGNSIVDYCIDICQGEARFFSGDPKGRIVEILLPASVPAL